MRYTKYSPCAELTPFLECYFVWQGHAQEELDVQSPPSCKGAIVINLGDPTRAYSDSGELIDVPRSFVCGQFTTNFHRFLRGRIDMAGIVFKPTALHNFFGLRMSELVNNRIPLSLLLNAKETTLFNQLNSQLKDEDRVKLLEEWMLVQLPIAKKNLSIIDEVADFIDEKKGLIAIEEVAAKFKVSRRYLEKQFLQKVGVSPKLYTRLKRFVMLSLELAYNNNSDWQELLEKAKLHDQSHLVKEFLEFNKENPTEYFKNHHEMTRFVKTK